MTSCWRTYFTKQLTLILLPPDWSKFGGGQGCQPATQVFLPTLPPMKLWDWRGWVHSNYEIKSISTTLLLSPSSDSSGITKCDVQFTIRSDRQEVTNQQRVQAWMWMVSSLPVPRWSHWEPSPSSAPRHSASSAPEPGHLLGTPLSSSPGSSGPGPCPAQWDQARYSNWCTLS